MKLLLFNFKEQERRILTNLFQINPKVTEKWLSIIRQLHYAKEIKKHKDLSKLHDFFNAIGQHKPFSLFETKMLIDEYMDGWMIRMKSCFTTCDVVENNNIVKLTERKQCDNSRKKSSSEINRIKNK